MKFKPTSEIKLEFLGITGCNPFAAMNSSPRSVMFFNHFSQRPSLLTPDNKLVKTGIEYELAKYINDIRTEDDCIVRGLIPRYFNAGLGLISSITLLVEYERIVNNETKIVFDMIDIPYYNTQHTVFGYNLKPTEILDNIHINQEIPKDSILATTDSYMPDGSYGYGLNANVCFMSMPEVSEDGFVVSKSFAKRAAVRVIETRVIYIDKDIVPVNLYGDENKFKFLPDIGENVSPNGLLCASKSRNDWFSVTDLNNKSIREYDPIFDKLTYVKSNSKVIDIKVVKGNYKKNEFSPMVTEQLDSYANLLNTYYQSVQQQVNKLIDSKKSMFKSVENVELSPKLHRFMTDITIHLDATNPNSKIKLTHRKVPINMYRIEVVTESYLIPNRGYKLTCTHAGKGVICKVLNDEDMPVDEYGNKADVICDNSSTISRMNLGRTYEAYLGATARDNRSRFINYILSKYNGKDIYSAINFITSDDVEYIISHLIKLYGYINPKMVVFIKSLNIDEKLEHVRTVLLDNMYIYYPPDNSINVVDVIKKINKSEYKPVYSPVTYKDASGAMVTTKENIRVGNMYMMILEKVADSHMAVSSAKVNNFSLPVKVSSSDKYGHQHSLTPTKTLGETEYRIFTSYMSKLAAAEIMDINTNPNTHKQVVKNILETDRPMRKIKKIDRKVSPYGHNKPLLIFKHMTSAYGVSFKYIKED